jgi:outer membrane immunogenic protein
MSNMRSSNLIVSVTTAVGAILGIGAASAADLPVKAPVMAVAPIYSWTGFYIGGNLGYSFGRSSNTWDVFAPNSNGSPTSSNCPPGGNAFCASGGDTNRLNGIIGGLQAGYNWQAGKYLFGLEADIQSSGQKHDQLFTMINQTNSTFQGIPITGTVAATYSENLSWLSTVRGRVGFASDRWMFYATGGLAVGQVSINGSATANGLVGNAGSCTPINQVATTCPLGSFSNSVTRAGWTLGAGVEGAFAGNWSWKVEYLHVDLGTVNTAYSTLAGCYGGFLVSGGGQTGSCSLVLAGRGAISSRITDEIVRIGINYHFTPGPVVARY